MDSDINDLVQLPENINWSSARDVNRVIMEADFKNQSVNEIFSWLKLHPIPDKHTILINVLDNVGSSCSSVDANNYLAALDKADALRKFRSSGFSETSWKLLSKLLSKDEQKMLLHEAVDTKSPHAYIYLELAELEEDFTKSWEIVIAAIKNCAPNPDIIIKQAQNSFRQGGKERMTSYLGTVLTLSRPMASAQIRHRLLQFFSTDLPEEEDLWMMAVEAEIRYGSVEFVMEFFKEIVKISNPSVRFYTALMNMKISHEQALEVLNMATIRLGVEDGKKILAIFRKIFPSA